MIGENHQKCKTFDAPNIQHKTLETFAQDGNFEINQEECLTELCATCIGHHTDVHALTGTLPHYENIQQTYRKAHDAVDAHRVAIEGEKEKIVILMLIQVAWSEAWERKKDNIYNCIRRAKKDVLDLVEITFSELEHSYAQKIHEEEIKVEMKNGEKAMRMLEAHTCESDKLYSLQKDLPTVRGPQAIKALYAEFLPRNTEMLNRISSDLKILEGHDLRIDYGQNNLIQIKQDIMNLFSLQVCYPEKVIVREPLVEFFQTGSFTEKPLLKSRSSFFSRPVSVGKSLTADNFYGSRIIEPKISLTDNLSQTLRSSNGFVRCSRRTNLFPHAQIVIR